MLAPWSLPPSTGARRLRTQILRLRSAVRLVSLAGLSSSCSKPVVDVSETAAAATADETTPVASVVNAMSFSTSTPAPSDPQPPNAVPPVIPHTAVVTEDERPRSRSGAASVAPLVAPSAADVSSPRQGRPSPPPSTVSKLTTTLPQTGEGYRTYAQVNTPVVIGKNSTVTIHLDPQPPFKSNDKYPYRFTITGSRGVTSSAQVVTAAAITPTKTTLQLSLEGNVPGPGSLAGMFSFSVCTPEKCLVERTPLVLNFEVVADALSASPQL